MSHVAELWTSPAMAAYQHLLIGEAVRTFARPVAQRTGTDVVHDLYPTLVAAAAVTTIFTAMEHCTSDPDDPLARAAAVHQGFEILRSGFQPPGPPLT